MNMVSYHTRSSSSRRCTWILILLLFLLQPALASGSEPVTEAPAQSASVSAPSLVHAWSWNTLFGPVQTALGNRRRMIQFATIGMCIGLYILMRK